MSVYSQRNPSQDKVQDYSNKKDYSREEDSNYTEHWENSFDSSCDILDISQAMPQPPNNSTNFMASKENSDSNHFQDSASQNGPVVKITDVNSSPLNTTRDQSAKNQGNDAKTEERDLSKNYVYRILSRSLYGKVELLEQKQLEARVAERKALIESGQGASVDSFDGEVGDDRGRIVDLIVDYELYHYGYDPTKERWFAIAKSFKDVFIYQDEDLYIGVNSDGSLKGKFASRARTLRSRAIRSGLLKDPRERKTKAEVTVSTPQSIAYFKTAKKIDTNLIAKWNEKRDAIIVYFLTTSIPSIFNEFLFLSEADGYQRLVDGYNSRREVKVELMKKWPRVAPIVFRIAKLKATRNPRHKQDLKQIVSVQIASGPNRRGHIENIALKSLPHILGPVTCTVKAKTKDSWKASVVEAGESFILHIEDDLKEGEELPERTEALKALFTKNGLMVAVGKLENIKHLYIVLGDFKHRIDGLQCLVRIVDICYRVRIRYKKNHLNLLR
ncbi:hypothetical protein QAD02_013310 [Eretmocerus hayati]|uniref:Uncharacterized protein n=1 Tax=Eretmocerus hayati TaxID=131215 RepID=A0ACC2P344_9HYME|nr:hypothetical protein QAD02_013310 [Eretmocerus hayati]